MPKRANADIIPWMAHESHRGEYEPLTAERRAAFLAALKASGSWTLAARYASRGFRGCASTFRSAARRDPAFARAIAEARAVHAAEQVARRERREMVTAQIAFAASSR